MRRRWSSYPLDIMYWEDMQSSVLPNIDFGEHMACKCFETILSYLQMLSNPNQDDQVLDFIKAVNNVLKSAITPDNVVALDEDMIKLFHQNLKGKVKIIRKPRPVGNELKDMSDARCHIVIKLDLHEGKDDLALKEHVRKFPHEDLLVST